MPNKISLILITLLCHHAYSMDSIARITTWPEEQYHAAYQGAQDHYTFGKKEYQPTLITSL